VVALGLQRGDLGLAHAEEEEVVVADELADLDVGAVVGADRQAPLRVNFMLPVPEASLPAREICSDRSAAGMIFSARVTL
jgi:hypothetical protein